LKHVIELLDQIVDRVQPEADAVRFTLRGPGRFAFEPELTFVDEATHGHRWGHLERKIHFDPHDPPGGMHNLRYAVNAINAEGLGGLQAILFPVAIALRRQVLVSNSLDVDTLSVHLDALYEADAPVLKGIDRLLERESWTQALRVARNKASRGEDLGPLQEALRGAGVSVEECGDHLRVGAVELRWVAGCVHADARVKEVDVGGQEARVQNAQPAPAVEALLAVLEERNRACPYALGWRSGGVFLRALLHARDLRPESLRAFLALVDSGLQSER
jgi:hypothetical protein